MKKALTTLKKLFVLIGTVIVAIFKPNRPRIHKLTITGLDVTLNDAGFSDFYNCPMAVALKKHTGLPFAKVSTDWGFVSDAPDIESGNYKLFTFEPGFYHSEYMWLKDNHTRKMTVTVREIRNKKEIARNMAMIYHA